MFHTPSCHGKRIPLSKKVNLLMEGKKSALRRRCVQLRHTTKKVRRGNPDMPVFQSKDFRLQAKLESSDGMFTTPLGAWIQGCHGQAGQDICVSPSGIGSDGRHRGHSLVTHPERVQESESEIRKEEYQFHLNLFAYYFTHTNF